MTRRLLSALTLLFLLPIAPARSQAPAAVQPPELAGVSADLDHMVLAACAADPIGGVTVGVVAAGRLGWSKSCGHADMEAKRPATDDTVYRIGSITKQFTALMLLQLTERGTLRLTDPLEKYFPDANKVPRLYPEMRGVTLLQVATMTSGLSREPGGPPDHSVGAVARWEDKVQAALPLTRFAHEPGTRYLYSNIGYAMLGSALGRAAGQPYVDYVREKILVPLGMADTGFEPTPAMRPRLARGYEVSRDGTIDGEASVREWEGRGYRVPNGALFSTVGDLARFVAFELGHGPESVLKATTLDDNYSRVYSSNERLNGGYGLGFQATRRGDLVALGHGGSTAGYRAQALFHRGSRIGVIVLRNVGGSKLDPQDLALRVLERVAARKASTSGQQDVARAFRPGGHPG
jgi:CubicO group peptidase (beta-lactamase class C family)